MKTNMINEYVLNQAKKTNPEITHIISVTKDSDNTIKAICADKTGVKQHEIITNSYVLTRHYQTKLHNEICSLEDKEETSVYSFFTDKDGIISVLEHLDSQLNQTTKQYTNAYDIANANYTGKGKVPVTRELCTLQNNIWKVEKVRDNILFEVLTDFHKENSKEEIEHVYTKMFMNYI